MNDENTIGIDELIEINGVRLRLGNRPTFPRVGCDVYGSVPTEPTIPREEWKGLVDAIGTGPEDWSVDAPHGYGHDQDGIGMCNASATCSAAEAQRAKQGFPLLRFSGGDLYKRICGGSDNGSTLEDGIREAMRGLVTTNAVPYLQWRGPETGDLPILRKSYQVQKASLCPRFDEVFSAVLKSYDLVSGIWWYDSYARTDAQGWLPKPGGRRGGHAIHGYKPTYRVLADGSIEYGIWHKQSWESARYGLNGSGRFVIPERCYDDHGIGGWWAIRQMTDEGEVVVAG